MDANPKSRTSRIAALGLVIELIAIYRMTKIFRQLRAARKQRGDSARPSAVSKKTRSKDSPKASRRTG